jgi:hypothetical protein
MRMNISVPDALAEEVRRRELPISAICQRALREEVGRLRVIEEAHDILVYVESEQADPDPSTWPRFTPGTPTLIYKPWPVGSRLQLLWVLEYEESPGNPTDEITPGSPDDPPIEWARGILRSAHEQGGMQKITVDVGDGHRMRTEGFTGRWLAWEEAATGEWKRGIALTKGGQFAWYDATPGAGKGQLVAYASLGELQAEVEEENWPDGDPSGAAGQEEFRALLGAAADALGGEHVIWRDI